MKRGDLVTVAVSGDYGKPRPAVVIQSDWLAETDSVLVCLVTSTLRDASLHRLTLEPSTANGLRARCQVMVDKIMAVRREKCGTIFGHLDKAEIIALNRLLALAIGIAD